MYGIMIAMIRENNICEDLEDLEIIVIFGGKQR